MYIVFGQSEGCDCLGKISLATRMANFLEDKLIMPAIATCEDEIVRAGTVRQRWLLDSICDDRHHRPRPRRTAPELMACGKMRAADNASSNRPKLFARIVLTKRIEISDLRSFIAGDAQDLTALYDEGLTPARRNLDGSQMFAWLLRNLGIVRALLIVEPQWGAFDACNGQRCRGFVGD